MPAKLWKLTCPLTLPTELSCLGFVQGNQGESQTRSVGALSHKRGTLMRPEFAEVCVRSNAVSTLYASRERYSRPGEPQAG
jgi:hypothetical protein